MIRFGGASVALAVAVLFSAVSLPGHALANGTDTKKAAPVVQKRAAVPMPRPRRASTRYYRIAGAPGVAVSAARSCVHLGCRGYIVHGIQY
jgi:hypothetical protein